VDRDTDAAHVDLYTIGSLDELTLITSGFEFRLDLVKCWLADHEHGVGVGHAAKLLKHLRHYGCVQRRIPARDHRIARGFEREFPRGFVGNGVYGLDDSGLDVGGVPLGESHCGLTSLSTGGEKKR